jgi:hypothetical protein
MAKDNGDTQREVGAVFQDEQAFANAVFGLETAGFDRADLSALGQEEPLQACLAAADCAKHRAAGSTAPHEAVVLDDDAQQGRVLFTSLTATVAALLASGAALAATGGAAAPAVVAAIAAGGSVGGVGRFLTSRGEEARAESLKHQVSEGGIVLWTRVTSADEETKAETILRQNGATNVHAHDLAGDR